MKLFAAVGSPRKRGNTDLLIDALLDGARNEGATTEKVYLCDLHIEPCDGCEVCFSTGECVHQDDMIPLYGKLLDSDVWVLGTPVYFWGPSAWLKAFIDRWYYFVENQGDRLQGKRAVLVAPFGDADPATPRHLVGMLADSFRYMEMDFAGQILVTASERGEVAKDRAAMEKARELGRRLAKG